MKVTVSQTLSRTFDVDVFDGDTLEEAFKRQYWDVESLLDVLRGCLEERLDHYAEHSVDDDYPGMKETICQHTSCIDWNVDEFEIIPE